MFFPESRVRVFLHGRPADMRKSFTGLIALSKRALGQDPLSGHLFVFVNRKGDYLKALYFDRTGFCLWITVTLYHLHYLHKHDHRSCLLRPLNYDSAQSGKGGCLTRPPHTT